MNIYQIQKVQKFRMIKIVNLLLENQNNFVDWISMMIKKYDIYYFNFNNTLIINH